MKKKEVATFIVNIIVLIFSILTFVTSFIRLLSEGGNDVFLSILMPLILIIGLVGSIVSIIYLRITYVELLNANIKVLRYKPLTDEELEIIQDAKDLIRKVDENIVIPAFKIYEIKFLTYGWSKYDEDSQETIIFIPFRRFLKLGKDFCFLYVLQEILHISYINGTMKISDDNFLEVLTQVLIIWLVENYSEKYKVSKDRQVFSLLRLKKIWVKDNPYNKEVFMVQKFLEDYIEADFKELFLNYLGYST